MKPARKKGLTLIEILIAITVVALLTLTSIIAVPQQLKKGRDARRKADLDRVKTALYDYYFDHDCFPEPPLPDCGQPFGGNGTLYLDGFPCDPNGQAYEYQVTKIGGGKCSQWFRLFGNLEVVSDPIITKIHCDMGCGPQEKGGVAERTNCTYNYGVASTNTQIYHNCGHRFVCAPGGGPSGSCQLYEDPWVSGCPVVFDVSDCSGACGNPDNRCENASGKSTPEE